MPICSYLVIPSAGTARELAGRLGSLPGCDALRARNREAILLVTETEDLEEDEALRSRVQGIDDVEALILTFGQIASDDPSVGPSTLPDDERRLPLVRSQGGRRGPDGQPPQETSDP